MMIKFTYVSGLEFIAVTIWVFNSAFGLERSVCVAASTN